MAEIAALVGDPARATILMALMDGRALNAGELAYAARIAPQTASAHLAKLVEGRLVLPAKQGRHRYFRLASPKIAQMLEGIMSVAIDGRPRTRPTGPRDAAMRLARTCYDHLAGQLGVALADSLAANDYVAFDGDGGQVSAAGMRFFGEFGLDPAGPHARRRFCRTCLDWSERRWHLGGAVGAALASRCFALDWIERVRDSRAVAVTPRGREGLLEVFAIELPPSPGWQANEIRSNF